MKQLRKRTARSDFPIAIIALAASLRVQTWRRIAGVIARTPSLHELAATPFVSLRTFRKDGTGAQAAVWTLAHGDKLWVRTTASTFKLKRLRNDPRAELAICNGSGKKILSEFVRARARILEDDVSVAESLKLQQAKYGFQSTIIRLIHKLRGVAATIVVIELSLD